MSTDSGRLELLAIAGVPEVHPGDDLARLLIDTLATRNTGLRNGDVLVIAQKIVSKAEGRYVNLNDITPGKQAGEVAAECEKDPRLVELVLRESEQIVRCRPGLLIVRHRLGLVLANAGIDQSNLAGNAGSDQALLLPKDPDESCLRIRQALEQHFNMKIGVVISDSVGRAWRSGTVGLAIGLAGVRALVDLRGQPDLHGRELQATEIGHADQVAAAAVLLMGEGAGGTPVVRVRGLSLSDTGDSARELVRARDQDLFL